MREVVAKSGHCSFLINDVGIYEISCIGESTALEQMHDLLGIATILQQQITEARQRIANNEAERVFTKSKLSLADEVYFYKLRNEVELIEIGLVKHQLEFVKMKLRRIKV